MTLSEALAASEEATGPVNDVLNIDAESREIDLPASESLFGVEGEKDVERKYFRCPKIVGDNIDLSTHQIYVHYTTATTKTGGFDTNKMVGAYRCDDVKDDESGNYITFSWLLSDNVLSQPGFVGFAVFAKYNEGEELKTKWKTQPAIGTVAMTVPDGEVIAEKYPDVINQIFTKLAEMEKGNVSDEAVAAAVSDYMAANPVNVVVDSELNEESANPIQNKVVAKKFSELSKEIDDLVLTSGGVTNAQRQSLIAVIEAIGVFNVANGQQLVDDFKSAWEITIEATKITLDKTVLSFDVAVSQTLTATVEPSGTTEKVVWSSSSESIATVVNGIVTPVSNGSCTITATCGKVSASCEVTVNVETEIVTYTITNNLTNVTTDNPITSITENSGYTANLTPSEEHEFDSVVVTMNGVDITDLAYSNGVITIESVTGNVIIIASAVQSDNEEVVLLKSITGDGASYIDTEFVAESLDNKYLLGVEYVPYEEKGDSLCLFGTRRSIFGSDKYNEILVAIKTGASNYDYSYTMQYGIGVINQTQVTLSTGNNTNDSEKPNVSRFTDGPLYLYISNGKQILYVDEDMTTTPKNGTFMTISGTSTFDESFSMNIIPFYIGAWNDKYQTVKPSKATFHCFKVWDENDNLIVDMRPAKKGSKIGMYDNIRKTFHENKGTGTFTYEELGVE